MRDFGKLKNGMAILMIFFSIIIVYSVTSTINIIAENDPKECNATQFTIKEICFNTEKTSFNNFQTTIDIDITDVKTDINGFKVKMFGSKGFSPAVIFRTVRIGQEARISPNFNKELYGDIEKVEITPILNVNQEILYCSQRHGVIIKEEVKTC